MYGKFYFHGIALIVLVSTFGTTAQQFTNGEFHIGFYEFLFKGFLIACGNDAHFFDCFILIFGRQRFKNCTMSKWW